MNISPSRLGYDIPADKLDILRKSCPIWIKHILAAGSWKQVIGTPPTHDDEFLSLENYQSCVVGEVMGFKNDYCYTGCRGNNIGLENISGKIYNSIHALKERENSFSNKETMTAQRKYNNLVQELTLLATKIAENNLSKLIV